MKKIMALLLAATMTVSLAACSGNSGTGSTAANGSEGSGEVVSSDSSDAASGDAGGYVDVVGSAAPGAIATESARDTFNFAMVGEPITLDPCNSKDATTPTGWMYSSQLYDTLLLFDPNTQEFYPRLATSWEINDDFTEIVFELRKDAKFHCGELITADHVVWSLTHAMESEFTASLSEAIDHFEKVDDNHIKLVMKYAYAPILQVMTVPCWGIICQDDYEKSVAEGTDFGRNPCGSGAYKLASWETGKQLTFDAVEGYWEGEPGIKHVVNTIVGDVSSGALALEQGSIDYFPSVSTTDFDYLSTLDNVHTELLPGTAIVAICMNTQREPFTDVRVRQAIALALNREEILLGGKDGMGSVANCYCAPVCTGYDASFEATAQDLEKAKALLTEAGYPDGFTVECQQDSSPTYLNVAEVVQAQLKEIGINLEFNKMERTTWMDLVSVQMDFDITVRQSMYSIFDADYLLTRRLHSKNIGAAGNYSGYSNKELDEILDAARIESDTTKRNELYSEAYTIVRDEAPMVPLLYNASLQAISSKLMGMMDDFSWKDLWNRLYFIA
ncbi:MAG: ABC transporter substrate-binding protein [Clostridiales bacterium]|nr:ABC transporter substrate-binding protein [Clostridiales bacterium]